VPGFLLSTLAYLTAKYQYERRTYMKNLHALHRTVFTMAADEIGMQTANLQAAMKMNAIHMIV
jgi:hypothetical protein